MHVLCYALVYYRRTAWTQGVSLCLPACLLQGWLSFEGSRFVLVRFLRVLPGSGRLGFRFLDCGMPLLPACGFATVDGWTDRFRLPRTPSPRVLPTSTLLLLPA